MKKIKTKDNKRLKFNTFDEVFAKSFKSKTFRDAYNEELVRLRLAHQIKKFRLESNLTQKLLLEKRKCLNQVIARIESGTHIFSRHSEPNCKSIIKK